MSGDTAASLMTSSDSGPLPTYEFLRKAHQSVTLTPSATRFYWTLNGPLSTALFVMAEGGNPDSPRQPYFRQTLSGTSWHPISQDPITTPGVSSISVSVYHLERWIEEWEECHIHAEPGIDGCVFGKAEGYEEREPEFDEDGEEILDLLSCCGEGRPPIHEPLVVRASEKPYVTIHDYMSAVHPWLMERRAEILSAKNVHYEGLLPPETKLAVRGLGNLMIEQEDSYVRSMRNFRQTAIQNGWI